MRDQLRPGMDETAFIHLQEVNGQVFRQHFLNEHKHFLPVLILNA